MVLFVKLLSPHNPDLLLKWSKNSTYLNVHNFFSHFPKEKLLYTQDQLFFWPTSRWGLKFKRDDPSKNCRRLMFLQAIKTGWMDSRGSDVGPTGLGQTCGNVDHVLAERRQTARDQLTAALCKLKEFSGLFLNQLVQKVLFLVVEKFSPCSPCFTTS